jgi:hypothetical protein
MNGRYRSKGIRFGVTGAGGMVAPFGFEFRARKTKNLPATRHRRFGERAVALAAT